MKLSLLWLKRHINMEDKGFRESLLLVENNLMSIGIEVEHVKLVNPIFNVTISKIETKPNLLVKICTVEITETQKNLISYDSTNIQVLTNCPQVKEGQVIAMAPLGTKVGDLIIGLRTIRGNKSEGMFITGEDINITFPGNEVLHYDDIIFTLSIPANRGDITHVRGIARELSIKLNEEMIPLNLGVGNEKNNLTVDNSTDVLICYGAMIGANINKEIHMLMDNIGQTNQSKWKMLQDFILIDIGFPVTFYDKYNHLIIKQNKNIEVYSENHELLNIIGIKEFVQPEDPTSDIIIEAAFLPKSYITYYEDEPTTSPKIYNNIIRNILLGIDCETPIISYIYGLVESKHNSSIIYTGLPKKQEPKIIEFPLDLVYHMTGFSLSMNKIRDLLELSSIKTTTDKVKRSDSINDIYIINCEIPTYRQDLHIAQDLVEEILIRMDINSYNIDVNPEPLNKNMEYNHIFKEVANFLVSQGLKEVYSIPFASRGELEILNPINKEEKYLRSDLKACLQKKAQRLLSLGHKDCRLFEIGKIYPSEETVFGILFTGKRNQYWSNKNNKSNDHIELGQIMKNINSSMDYEIESLEYDDEFNLISQAYYVQFKPLKNQEKVYSHQEVFYENYHNMNITTDKSWSEVTKFLNIPHKLVDIYETQGGSILTITLMGTKEEIECAKSQLAQNF